MRAKYQSNQNECCTVFDLEIASRRNAARISDEKGQPYYNRDETIFTLEEILQPQSKSDPKVIPMDRCQTSSEMQ